MSSLKRLWAVVEVLGTLIGFLWLFGPPAWQPVNRGVTTALLVLVLLIGGFGAYLIVAIVVSQRQPPYSDRH